MSRARRTARLLAFGARRLEYADKVENPDGTFDLIGVEILSAGGPIHGIGSPPEGDFWTVAELRAMADADAELGDELLPPNKIGHPDEQTLVANSIAAGDLPSDGEMPAVGWLEDLRVEGSKLLADVRKVPKLVADAIDVGAYRTRSTELSSVTSQRTGKSYDWVVTGLAWLGGKIPAVRTLGDVVALYEGDVDTTRTAIVFAERELAAGDVVWNPDDGFEYLRGELSAALNPGPQNQMEAARYWVRDLTREKALVEDWQEEPGVAWVVPFQIVEGRAVPGPQADWIRAEEGWLEVGRSNVARLVTAERLHADTSAMKYTAEQRRAFAEATGLDESKVTDKMLEAAGVAGETDEPAPTDEPKPDEPKPDEPKPDEPKPDEEPAADEPGESAAKALEARLTGVETELRIERRNNFIETEAIGKGKIEPGQRKDLEALYDLSPDRARAFVESLPEREELVAELGRENADDVDDDDVEPTDRNYAQSSAYKNSAVNRLGISEEALV